LALPFEPPRHYKHRTIVLLQQRSGAEVIHRFTSIFTHATPIFKIMFCLIR
jgi:hypothetical protein